MNYQEQIERYLSNTLAAHERAEFEELMRQDPALTREVENAKFAIEKLKALEQQSLKNRLQNIESQIARTEKAKIIKPVSWLIIIIATIGLVIWFNRQESTNTPELPFEIKPESDSNVNVKPLESIQPDTPPVIPPAQKELRKDKLPPKINREEIYAVHFTPYTNDDIEYEVRGDKEKSPYELYKHYYINGKYDQVLATFEDLDPNLKMDHQVLLIKANVLMAQKKFSPALMILRSLEQDIHSPIFKDVQWYLALCYIQVGQFEKAKAILNNPALSDPSKSKKLLDKL